MGLIMRNGIAYAGSNSIELTQAEYNALVSAGTVQPDTFYCIVDADNVLPASDVTYDNTDSGLSADSVQDAIDEVVTDISNIVKAKEVNISNSNLSNGVAMSQFLSIDSGYKFLCWMGIASVGWVMNRPMYFENPTYDNTKIWWAADMTLPANTNCRFSYLEIRDI